MRCVGATHPCKWANFPLHVRRFGRQTLGRNVRLACLGQTIHITALRVSLNKKRGMRHTARSQMLLQIDVLVCKHCSLAD